MFKARMHALAINAHQSPYISGMRIVEGKARKEEKGGEKERERDARLDCMDGSARDLTSSI